MNSRLLAFMICNPKLGALSALMQIALGMAPALANRLSKFCIRNMKEYL